MTDQEQEILEAVQALTVEVIGLRDENKRLRAYIESIVKLAGLLKTTPNAGPKGE